MNYIILTYVLAFFTLIVSVYANRSEKIVQTVVDKVNAQFNTIMVNNESIVQDQTSLNSSMNNLYCANVELNWKDPIDYTPFCYVTLIQPLIGNFTGQLSRFNVEKKYTDQQNLHLLKDINIIVVEVDINYSCHEVFFQLLSSYTQKLQQGVQVFTLTNLSRLTDLDFFFKCCNIDDQKDNTVTLNHLTIYCLKTME